MQRMISQDQWSDYHRDGFLKIGRQCSNGELAGLQRRIDEIMLGRAPAGLRTADDATGSEHRPV